MLKRLGSLTFLAFVVSCASGVSDDSDDIESVTNALQSETNPSGRKGYTNKASNGGGGTAIVYHNGPVMTGTTNVYYVWYGNWAGNTATQILADFASSVGGSPYFNINTTYYDKVGAHVSNSVHLGGQVYDSYSKGLNLTDANIEAIVTEKLTNGLLPSDSHGVYFVLTSEDVHETSGFCTAYCGWHYFNTAGVKYAFVGNPAQCPTACSAQPTNSPNSNVGADGMVSIVAHELEEAVTDPLLNAWYDRRGYENADKCAWTFGTTHSVSNGSKANMRLGTRDFLVQQNWLNVGNGKCALRY